MRHCVREQYTVLKRALKIIGYSALGGWVLTLGIWLTVMINYGIAHGNDGAGVNVFIVIYLLLLYSLLGAVGAAIVGLLAACLDRLINRPGN